MKKQKMFAVLLCAAMLISLLPTVAQADGPVKVYVTEDITTDTTWPAGDYYICKVGNREPRITNGATLTIESGANVYFSTRTTATLPGTEGDPKNPYSSLTVTNGTLSATDVTFTTVPDLPEDTTWQNAGWNDIRAVGAGNDGATSLSFTNCTFEYSGFAVAGTLYGTQTNGQNSEVNLSVSGCTFKNPNAATTAIGYDNGYNTVGTGTISVSGTDFTGYGRGVQVLENGDDAINTTVTDCTFSNISIRPLEINGGRQAVITGNSFNNFVTGQHDNPVLIYDGYSPTSAEQTVTLTGNTFNYGSGANIYPIVIGAGCKINEDITNPNNTFDAAYPAAYRYIVLSRGVGYSSNHRNAVWGDAGIPYLLASEITITGSDAANKSSLTIKPGVTVCLGDGSGCDNLAVRGDLTAIGTAAKPITFTKKVGVPYGREIAVSNNLRGSATLKHCVMDGLYRGIGIISPSASAGLISLENCTVQNTQEPMVLNGHNVLVKNCTLIGKGVWIDGVSSASSIMIERCSITAEGGNTDSGVGIRASKSVALKNCLIAGFGGSGVDIINNSYQTLAAGAPLIENCTVSGNRNGVVYSRSSQYFSYYGAIIRNSIISGNTGLDLANMVYTVGESNYPVTIADGSIAYSLIGDDGSALAFDGSGYYVHPVLGKISRIASSAYSNRITGDPLFAGASSGDYHLKSTAGRWNGSAWVTDAVTSPCIDAGDPTSAYANEPTPNGERINLGCYGNTAEASKSAGGGTEDTTPPSWSAGSTLTASAVTQTGATLSWSGASDDIGVTAYRLYRNGTLIQTTSNSSYAVTGLSPDTDYSFKVEAGDAAGNWSTDGPTTPVHTLAVTTPSVTPPAPVTEIGSGESVTTVNISRLVADGASLTVSGDDGAKLVFDAESLKGISKQAGGSVKVNIADVSDEYQQAHPGRLVFSLTVSSGDKAITDFGGSVAVSLPYELKEGEAADDVTVWHLLDNGIMVEIPCNYDPATGLASFTVSHFSLYIVGTDSPWENLFADVSEPDWFYNAVRFVHENGLMVGTGDTAFSPQTATARGMIVTILHRLEGAPAGGNHGFDDVKDGMYYADAVAWAAENKIISGYSDDLFGPEDAITREQMAVILMNYAKLKGYDVSAKADLSKYSDAEIVSTWATDAMSWANAAGLIQGDGTKLTPTGTATRAQAAAILQRFIEAYVK
jgi:hypothetical protein